MFGVFFEWTVGACGVLIPVLGILAVTSEFSQRTALTTFALVPRPLAGDRRQAARGARAGAGVGRRVPAHVARRDRAGAGGRARASPRGTSPRSGLAAAALFLAIWMVAGAAIGLLVMSSAPAIVLSFLIPVGIGGLASGHPGRRGHCCGGSTSGRRAGELNASHPTVSGQDWAQLAAGVAVWVLLPLAIGFVRLHRREVTSS